jgi:hypothetical protein
MGRKMVNQGDYYPLIEWINQEEHDFFWLEELRKAFDCVSSDKRAYPYNLVIAQFIAMLRDNGVIECTEVRKGRRQYHRVRIVVMEDLCRKVNFSDKQ